LLNELLSTVLIQTIFALRLFFEKDTNTHLLKVEQFKQSTHLLKVEQFISFLLVDAEAVLCVAN